MPELSIAWIALPKPAGCTASEWERVLTFARREARASKHAAPATWAPAPADSPTVLAAALVLADLFAQGWTVRVTRKGNLEVAAQLEATNADVEKDRVRSQELLKRDEQLGERSVARFIRAMEAPREHDGAFVSVYSLMRDGQDLAQSLEALSESERSDPLALRAVIDPYVQVIRDERERCAHTGLRLVDVWRYFRHTWSNQYRSTPGRSMMILVRDRAASHHPVVGIAALGSSIIQIVQRDEWIGWDADHFLARLAAAPRVEYARWVVDRLDARLGELYLEDLIEDGLYWPTLWSDPEPGAIDRLRKESAERRSDHQRFGRRSDFNEVSTQDAAVWKDRAISDLYRSKRAGELADLLEAKIATDRFLSPPTSNGLKLALGDAQGLRAIRSVLRRAKSDAVGTEIADLTVCGAVAPYNALLGGKLVSMLAVSPTVVRAYHQRYAEHTSQIASSMAGRAITRRSNLAFIGTTSLYGSNPSQYNRVKIPAEALGGGSDIEFKRLGRSRSFGTSHLSDGTVRSLVTLSEHSLQGVRVKSIFGEGVNPKLRKVRSGLDELGWPSDLLLRHGRRRIIYGVELTSNMLRYLLGLDRRPKYCVPRDVQDDVERISAWWSTRWLAGRLGQTEPMAAVRANTLVRPVRHGARVVLPPTVEDTD